MNFLTRWRRPKLSGRIIEMHRHRSWSDSIFWLDPANLELSGHMTPGPVVGDEVRCEMESGRMGRYRITSVGYCSDPPDMFFAQAEWLGYADEVPHEPR